MTAGEYFGDWMEVIDGPELRRVVTWMSKLDKSILCPSSQNVFKAFQACSLKDCKVVFLGQDPYPAAGSSYWNIIQTRRILQKRNYRLHFR